MRSATCHNLSLLGTHSISDSEPMSGGFHTTWPKLRSSKWKWCLLDQLRSSLPALGRLIREDHLRGYFCLSRWYCMILANDPFAEETCWFVVIRVGSIPTQHKSFHANIPVQQYSFVTSLTSKLVDNTWKGDVPNSCWKCSFPLDFDSKVCNLVGPSACQGFGNNTEEWWGSAKGEVTLLTITALTTMIKTPHKYIYISYILIPLRATVSLPRCHCHALFSVLTLTITWMQWKANSFLAGPA